jgi:hypothetical protein
VLKRDNGHSMRYLQGVPKKTRKRKKPWKAILDYDKLEFGSNWFQLY